MKLHKLHLLCFWVLAAILPLALVRLCILYNSSGFPTDLTSFFMNVAHEPGKPVPAVWNLITPMSRNTTDSTPESDVSSQLLPTDSDQNLFENSSSAAGQQVASSIEEVKTVDKTPKLDSQNTQDPMTNDEPWDDHMSSNNNTRVDVEDAKNMSTTGENLKDHDESENNAAHNNYVQQQEEEEELIAQNLKDDASENNAAANNNAQQKPEELECSKVDLQRDFDHGKLGVEEDMRSGCNKSSSNELSPTNTNLAEVAAMKHSQKSSNLAAGVTAAGVDAQCDLSNGTWVHDAGAAPAYTNDTCNYIQGHQNCLSNGRIDRDFLYWRWKPNKCELPQIDARKTLESLRGKSMVFVGDSIARNQFQSLLCILSQVEDPAPLYHSEDYRDNSFVFTSHSFTLAVRWSPYLVRQTDKEVRMAADNNSTQVIAHLDLDLLDDNWVQEIVGVDIVVVSSGQWWYKAGVFLEHGKIVGCHNCGQQLGQELEQRRRRQESDEAGADGTVVTGGKRMGFDDAYRRAMRNVLKGVLSIPGYNGITVLRSFAPDHFENGSWDTGGSCPRTEPGGVSPAALSEVMYQIQLEEFHKLLSKPEDFLHESSDNSSSSSSSEEEEEKKKKTMVEAASSRLKLVDISNLAQMRADGHPNGYREYKPGVAKDHVKMPNDCLHWCLPGPIDTWNDMLMESLQQQLLGSKLR